MSTLLALNESLVRRSRLGGSVSADSDVRARELLLLVGCGLAAAVFSALVDFNLRVPGHAILRAVLPLSLGMALVPRRGAGMTMGAAAIVGLAGLSLAGAGEIGLGATTSLIVTGPLIDLAVRRARPGWRLYASFSAAGLLANLAAFVVRGGAKAIGGSGAGLRPLHDWLTVAPVSYVACGLLAGLVSAAIWFRASDRPPIPPSVEPVA